MASYASEERGIEVRAVAGGFKMYTKPQHHDVVRRFIKSLRPPLRLTMPALETLAVISYKQPVTAPEIQEIRGVNTSGVLKTLLDKRLITTAGRKEVIGRPILYRTSKEFLMRFGLSDLQELPSLKEFEALAREALGTDEGIAAPGAGDESVLDGITRSTAESAGAPSTREPNDFENTAGRESQPIGEQPQTVLQEPDRQVWPDGANASMQEPSSETPAAEPPAGLTRSDAEPDTEFAGSREEKSRKATVGE